MYYCCGMTEKGIRPHNEDALLLPRTVCTGGTLCTVASAPFLVAVCDGVSGENAGEIASESCLNALSALKYSKKTNLSKKIIEIHHALADLSRQSAATVNMQTTLCGFAIDETNAFHCFNVGDSRIYRFRGGSLEQISRDQTLVQMLYEEGTITSEEKRVHTHKNVVLPVMGNLSEDPTPEIRSFDEGMLAGDVLLLCTDGLTDYVTAAEIEEILAKPVPLPHRVSAMVSLALSKGGRDNVTVAAVVRYPDQIPIPDSLLR